MANYITVAEVLAKLDGVDLSAFPDINTLIETVYIPTAQVMVNSYVNKNLSEITKTEFFDGNGLTFLSLGVNPVQSVSECVIYSVPYTSEYLRFNSIAKTNVLDGFGNVITTEELPVSVTDLVLDCAKGFLTIPEGASLTSLGTLAETAFVCGNRNIKVTFTSGYSVDNIPQGIKDAAAYTAAILVLLSVGTDLSSGVSKIKIGQVTKEFGFGTSGSGTTIPYGGVISNYEKLTMLLLEPYVTIRV